MRTLFNRFLAFCILAALAAFVALGCSSLKDAGTNAARAIVDCTKRETATLVGELRPVMGSVIAHAVTNAGKLDYGPVKDIAKGFASDIARCSIADAVARLVNPPPDDPAAPNSAPLQVDREAARVGFRELYPGVRFKTEHGEL